MTGGGQKALRRRDGCNLCSLQSPCPGTPSQPSHHAPSPPARFADEQRSPPAGTFPYTPSSVLCSVQIPDPARSRHGGSIYPLPSPDSPSSGSPLGAPLPSEGPRARVPGRGGLSSGPAAPARLPGCGRCLLRVCPEPGHRSRRGAQPPRGTGTSQGYRSHPGHRSLPGVPEPPAGTRGAELPGCGAAQRYRSRRGARPPEPAGTDPPRCPGRRGWSRCRRSPPLLPAPRRCLPLPRAATARPGRGGCLFPAPLPGNGDQDCG